jgi:chromosome segregation ATPase
MRRPLLASLAVGLGLACGAYALSPAWAQAPAQPWGGQGGGNAQREQSPRDRDDDSSDPASQKIEKALQTYESFKEKSGPNLDQTRKEIERLRDELIEIVKLRSDMALSLAEIRAEMTANTGQGGMAQLGGGYAAQGSGGGYAGGGGGGGYPAGYGGVMSGRSPGSREDRQALRREALARELRQLQEQLRNEVEQSRVQADQLVAQMRDIRNQQRQMREQIRAAQEQMERDRQNASQQQQGKQSNQPNQGDRPKDQDQRGEQRER